MKCALVIFFSLIVCINTENTKTIIEEPKCGDIKLQCGNLSENDDLLILECLQAVNPSFISNLNEDCQHVVWTHTRNLLQNARVKDRLIPICRADLDRVNCKIDEMDGSYLRCIINNRESISNPECKRLVFRLENIAFGDGKWISGFLPHCEDEIKNLGCGRLDHGNSMKTVTCLQKNIMDVKNAECKQDIFKLSEIQSDNIKLDRQLYKECAQDHLRYCSDIEIGSGQVFACLMQQKDRVSNNCKQQLLRRQKLISQDFKISKGLMRGCREDIKKTHCKKHVSSDKNVRLAQILLCLELEVKNGTKLDTDCLKEMVDHRRVLMQDYRLSPEIVSGCRTEINNFCQGLDIDGKTIHCLMKHAMPNSNDGPVQMKPECKRALEDLVKKADVGENWRVDPILYQACNPVVQTSCRGIHGGDARIMSCLMDNIGADHMTEECEDALIQIQYFVARDFKLDPQLYRSCREDASRLCHVKGDYDTDKVGPSYGPEVLPCLYRYAFVDNELKLKKTCLQQIQRVMRQRAISVDLMPEIEEACIDDLAYHCHDKTKKGEEMMCLQKKLDEVDEKCRTAVELYTEIEAEHVELNPYIMKYCRNIIDSLCSTSMKNDEGDVMDCLISNKNNPVVKMNQPCRASIEHFQLISLKNYRFTYKLKVACKPYFKRFCSHITKKNEVIQCLSEQILNATVAGVKSPINKECKQQIKSQLFQKHENINYNPNLKSVCEADIQKFCNDIKPGNAEVLECLQIHRKELTPKCRQETFKFEKQEIFDNSIDYSLMTMCAEPIQQYCPHHAKETVLECLKKYKDNIGFNKKCFSIVMHRLAEEVTSYQLNPTLQQYCHMDISKFCKTALKNINDKDVNGSVIKCLKDAFKLSKLSNKCEKAMADILREQALHLELNPLLRAVCGNELKGVCKMDDGEGGDAEECLKNALLNKQIQTPECKVEVANMIEESQADIEADPLLQEACSLDLLNLCQSISQGNGRRIKCLKYAMENNPKQITPKCSMMLNKRFEMYKNAALNAPPESFNELYHQVTDSPAKHYFFLMIMIVIGSIFVVGMFCGRISRKHQLIKNK